MSIFYASMTVLCVVGISIGQLLFKKAALVMQGSNGLADWLFNGWLIAAFALYGFTTLLWVWILKHVPLHQAYPFMALAFLIVPLLGHFVLGESVSVKVILGGLLIMVGVVISSAV